MPPASCRGCEISPALFEAPRGYSVLGGQREATTRDDDDDLLQFAIQQSLLEAGSEYDQVRPGGRAGVPYREHGAPPLTGSHPAPQVTIWEALTNSKPGTHPMSYEGRRQDRSVPARPERLSKRLCPHPRPHTHREHTRVLTHREHDRDPVHSASGHCRLGSPPWPGKSAVPSSGTLLASRWRPFPTQRRPESFHRSSPERRGWDPLPPGGREPGR